jgi:opacity protein-like surface antigen
VNGSTIRSDDQGWIGNLSINYSGEKTSGSLTFNQDVITASGRSGTTERTGVSTNLSERFTRELSGFIGMGYSWNRSAQNQFSAQPIDEKSLTFNGGLRYDFSEYVYLEGNYRYNNINYSNLSSQATQNVFMLRLTMRRDVMDL